MNKYRNIKVAQCEVLEMHKLTNQIPDNLETMQRDTIYIHIPDALLPQWRAGSEDARGAAAFITHGIEAEFGIAVDGTLSLTKTKTKTVLLALEAVPYRCKLTIYTDSQAVITTAQKWLFKNSPLSIRNQLKTSNWHTWNAIRAIIREKRIDFNMNKMAAHTGILENKKADKLAKESTTLDTVDNNKVQKTIEFLDQDINWTYTTKIWNWDGKMSSGNVDIYYKIILQHAVNSRGAIQQMFFCILE
ncbi:hypothetical protein G9A89_005038 [Geosiphon pyriformis]|nr:hypothetical protein G9A89_005038 [Geosiphon pyriformis]